MNFLHKVKTGLQSLIGKQRIERSALQRLHPDFGENFLLPDALPQRARRDVLGRAARTWLDHRFTTAA